jgi:branched-chain amino acid transport system substrate-binding protein
MNKKIAMSSSTLGDASELQRLPPAVSEGLITVANYFDELKTPAAESFRKQYAARFGGNTVDSVIAPADYYGLLLWAEGVRKANSTDRDAVVKALETGVSVDGPSGRIAIDPASHHCLMNIFLGTVKDGRFEIERDWQAVSPSGDDKRCDLVSNPETNTQFGVMK